MAGKNPPDVGSRGYLTADKEAQLIRQSHAGDEHARNELILRHLGLVINAAQKALRSKPHPSAEIADLVQEAIFPLTSIIKNFKFDQGARFQTYMRQRLLPEMISLIEEQVRTVAVPRKSIHFWGRMTKATGSLISARSDQKLMPDEIRMKAKLSKGELISAFAADRKTISGTDSKKSLHQLPSNRPDVLTMVSDAELSTIVGQTLASLPPKQKQVLCMQFGFAGYKPATIPEIGKAMGISDWCVTHVRAVAFDKILTGQYGSILQSFMPA